jgi:glucose-1-phosphate cytidylyltransferase
MKVVLFCGGLGLRLREHSERLPKPMVPIGYRPALWYVMKYYAHFGHNEFILCLGHQSHVIKDYFRNYDETVTNNFVLSKGGVELLGSDAQDWRITFVDTGLKATIGQRLMAVRKYLGDDEMFLANYADVLTDYDLNTSINTMNQNPNLVGSMICIQPNYSFHMVQWDEQPGAPESQMISGIGDIQHSEMWINGGYFVLRQSIFDHMNWGEDLVVEPFQRLIEKQQLAGIRHRGFWAPMDTLKEKLALDARYENGDRPWCVWEHGD